MRWCALIVGLLLLSGCASETFAPEIAPEYIVLRERAAFYKFGPLQASPPDEFLVKDATVKLLRRELGYSLVQTSSSQTGYVANEDITLNPNPRPAPENIVLIPEHSPDDRSGRSQPPPSILVDDAPLPIPDFDLPPLDAPDPQSSDFETINHTTPSPSED